LAVFLTLHLPKQHFFEDFLVHDLPFTLHLVHVPELQPSLPQHSSVSVQAIPFFPQTGTVGATVITKVGSTVKGPPPGVATGCVVAGTVGIDGTVGLESAVGVSGVVGEIGVGAEIVGAGDVAVDGAGSEAVGDGGAVAVGTGATGAMGLASKHDPLEQVVTSRGTPPVPSLEDK
jgi:hypothetical protein